MKQTDKYKLNLIEPTDPFLPEGLNENTQKIEDAMTAHEEGIEQRLTVLEARKFAYGTYKGTYDPYVDKEKTQFISLPFTPKVVIIGIPSPESQGAVATEGYVSSTYLQLAENGFIVHYSLNRDRYNFIAFG